MYKSTDMISDLVGVLERSGYLLLDLLPYVLAGVFLAELLKYTPWTRFIKQAINRYPGFSVWVATALGVFSPLCTYGTVPIVINLYRGGVSLAPLITFLSASSLMNPQLFLITWGGLGLNIAVIRLVSIIVFSLLLGYFVQLIEKRYGESLVQKVNHKFSNECSSEQSWQTFKLKEFIRNAYKSFEFMGFYIVLGVVLSAALETFVPVSYLLQRGSGYEWVNILLASVISIPMYICGGGIIPVVEMLMNNGMSVGAVIAFLIVGPATRVTPLMALGSFLSKNLLGFYVVSLIAYSFFLGLVLNLLFM